MKQENERMRMSDRIYKTRPWSMHTMGIGIIFVSSKG